MNIVEKYIRDRYDFSEDEIARVIAFYEEHLEDSHQLHDLTELVDHFK